MPPEVILNYLANSSQWEQWCFRVVFQCAPVLKGVKASNLVTLPVGMWMHLFTILEGTGISCKILYSDNKKEILFLYREEWLKEIISRQEVDKFIGEYGYKGNEDIRDILKRLRCRYQAYMTKESEFPHELGIFLEYPLEDVRGFILSGGKNSLFSGYWKVYHNPRQARIIFQTYDRARENAAREYMNSKSIRQVICNMEKEVTCI